MATLDDNTDFAIKIVDKFIKILKKHVSEDKTVQKGSYIEEYGIGQGEGIKKFKSEMLNIFSGNFPVPKDDDIFTVDDVLRYYETINLDIEGGKKILDTFDRLDRDFKVPSPRPEEIAAATAETEGVSNVVPSGTAGNLVQELDEIIAREVGEVGEVEQGPVPSPAPAPIPQPQELDVVSGGGKKKRTHNKKKRRSKKKSTPVKKKK